MKRDLISLKDLSAKEIFALLYVAKVIKKKQKKGEVFTPLTGKTLGLIFHKPSARTRISFDVGMYQLGGHSVVLSEAEIGFGKRESIYDLAKLFSRLMDGVMIRTFAHQSVEELARESTIPVINGLTDFSHPCQILGDLMTLSEYRKDLKKLKIVYVGDGNNVCNSWLFATGILGLNFTLACPTGYEAAKPVIDFVKSQCRKSGAQITITHDAMSAVKDADVVYTDIWASMGQEKEQEKRKKVFKPYQVNRALIENAQKDVLVMHCLPAHRGEEITDDVMDGKNSIVFDQAENRLHAQKAVLVWLLRPDVFKKLLK
jgi:ornithine carbamoyltransferase